MSGISGPDDSLSSEEDPEDLLAAIESLARWCRAHRLVQGNLEETIAPYEETPCLEVLRFLHNTARHDSLMARTPGFNDRIGKGHASGCTHSVWWDLCDVFWEVFCTSAEGKEGLFQARWAPCLECGSIPFRWRAGELTC